MLDKYFGNVCELDIIFNFEKAYYVLDELILGGEVQETSKNTVLKAIAQQDLVQEDGEVPSLKNVLEELRLGFVIEERPRDKLRNLCCKRSEQPCGQLILVRCVSYLSTDRTVSYASVTSALAMGWTTLPLDFFPQALQHAHFDAHPMTPRTPRAPRQPRTTG